jgi:hypothetical protein
VTEASKKVSILIRIIVDFGLFLHLCSSRPLSPPSPLLRLLDFRLLPQLTESIIQRLEFLFQEPSEVVAFEFALGGRRVVGDPHAVRVQFAFLESDFTHAGAEGRVPITDRTIVPRLLSPALVGLHSFCLCFGDSPGCSHFLPRPVLEVTDFCTMFDGRPHNDPRSVGSLVVRGILALWFRLASLRHRWDNIECFVVKGTRRGRSFARLSAWGRGCSFARLSAWVRAGHDECIVRVRKSSANTGIVV